MLIISLSLKHSENLSFFLKKVLTFSLPITLKFKAYLLFSVSSPPRLETHSFITRLSQMARLLFQRTWWKTCFIWMPFMNKSNVRGIISVHLFIYLFSYSMQSAGGKLRDWPSLQFLIEMWLISFSFGSHWQVPELLLKGPPSKAVRSKRQNGLEE